MQCHAVMLKMPRKGGGGEKQDWQYHQAETGGVQMQP